MTPLSARTALGRWQVLLAAILVSVATMLVLGLVLALVSKDPGWDSRYAYLSAAESVLEGRSPYAGIDESVLEDGRAYVYPPLVALVFVPLAPVPTDLAASLAVVAALLALMGALAIAGVRDFRCYAAVLVWAPVWNAVENANISAALALGVALAWRFRATTWPLAAALGLAISVKLVLWPLLIWTAATRRLRAGALALAVGLGATLISWSLIGFDGLREYPELVSRISDVQAERSYSFVGMTSALELQPIVGELAMLVVGAAFAFACFGFGRQGDDRRAFTCAIVASLSFTPILWQHYLVLLLVPLALARPRFSAAWLLPIALWVSPRLGNGDGIEPFLPALVVLALTFVMISRPPARYEVARAV